MAGHRVLAINRGEKGKIPDRQSGSSGRTRFLRYLEKTDDYE